MDEKGMFTLLTNSIIILPFFIIIWLTTIFGTLIGCSKKKAGPVKKVGESAASNVSPLQRNKASTGNLGNGAAGAGGAAAAGNGAAGKPTPSPADNNNNNKDKNLPGAADPKNAAENKDDHKDEKKPDEKPDEKQSEKNQDEKKDEEKKDEEKKESKKDDEKKKEPSNKDENKKKSEKPNNDKNGDKKDGSGGDKASVKPELSTNRTQPSKSVKVKDDDDTVKHIESLKEDKEKSE